VKLVRVLMLAPLVLVFSLARRRHEAALVTMKVWQLVPWFVIGFLIAGGLRSSGDVSPAFAGAASTAARVLTVLAMAALGLNVDINSVRKIGPKVAMTVTGSLFVMVTIALAIVKWLPR
jgi:uncharacterized membrane protein YadS